MSVDLYYSKTCYVSLYIKLNLKKNTKFLNIHEISQIESFSDYGAGLPLLNYNTFLSIL